MIAFSFTALAMLLSSVAAEEAKQAPYQLQNRSSFGIPVGTRPPFWPIGWTKTNKIVVPVGQPVTTKIFQIQPGHFTITSILLSHPPLATINGRAFGEGEMLPVQVGGQPVRVVVKAIRDGGVWLDQSGHQIFVPMKRQEVAPRAAADPQQASQEFKIVIDEKK